MQLPRVFVVGITPRQLDEMTAAIAKVIPIDRMPTRILLSDPQEMTDRKFRGIRSGLVFTGAGVPFTWETPKIYTEFRDFLVCSIDV